MAAASSAVPMAAMNNEIIQKFYTAFQRKDWKAMQACYHDNATFHDPVFEDLDSKSVKAMWHMLLESDGQLEIVFNNVHATVERGICHWEASYMFSGSGRPVHNVIEASFVFSDGKILQHTDSFDLWKWSAMALGTPGKLLGWSGFMKRKIRSKAQKRLFAFKKVHAEYA